MNNSFINLIKQNENQRKEEKTINLKDFIKTMQEANKEKPKSTISLKDIFKMGIKK